MKKVGDVSPLKELRSRSVRWLNRNSVPQHNTVDLKEFGSSAAETAK